MLTINHDNYETWLMLYLDNELTAAEREAVEAFAKANPAVQEELDGLKGTMLQPELPVPMPGKERLLMPELWNEEALTPRQQQLLMLADNELPEQEMQLITEAISASPLLQKEWSLLEKTRLQAGKPLEMPGKDQLYRQEKSRVIPFGRVMRFAAAAAILGFGWFAIGKLTQTTQNTQSAGQVAISNETENNTPSAKADTARFTVPARQMPLNEPMTAAAATTENGSKRLPLQKAKALPRENEPQVAFNDPGAGAVTAEDYGNPATHEAAATIGSIRVVEVEGIAVNDAPPVINTEKAGQVAVNTEEKPVTGYETVSQQESDEDKTINIAGARIPKQKIRNVYRNITRPLVRSFERTSQPVAYAR